MKQLRRHYENSDNIMHLLRQGGQVEENSVETVLMAYDLQAGSYVGHA